MGIGRVQAQPRANDKPRPPPDFFQRAPDMLSDYSDDNKQRAEEQGFESDLRGPAGTVQSVKRLSHTANTSQPNADTLVSSHDHLTGGTGEPGHEGVVVAEVARKSSPFTLLSRWCKAKPHSTCYLCCRLR
jgi:hypothetical protein